ncbi:MAG: DUF4358 domain-containing protein [Oscillospiraceae bacterium]|nr:DUF4358 domain-containing protein [Oscillospiraceae bacterium]
MKHLQASKRISAILVTLLHLSLLAACGGETTSADVPVSDIADAVCEAIGKTDSMSTAPDNYIQAYFKMDTDELGEYDVRINTYGANIDEFGVFKAGTRSVSELTEAVDDYLALRLESWMDEYMPEEKPKLESATVHTSGDYVIYCILSDADRETAVSAFDASLN